MIDIVVIDCYRLSVPLIDHAGRKMRGERRGGVIVLCKLYHPSCFQAGGQIMFFPNMAAAKPQITSTFFLNVFPSNMASTFIAETSSHHQAIRPTRDSLRLSVCSSLSSLSLPPPPTRMNGWHSIDSQTYFLSF